MLSIIVWSANISKICRARQSWTGTLGIAWKRVAKIMLTLDSKKGLSKSIRQQLGLEDTPHLDDDTKVSREQVLPLDDG